MSVTLKTKGNESYSFKLDLVEERDSWAITLTSELFLETNLNVENPQRSFLLWPIENDPHASVAKTVMTLIKIKLENIDLSSRVELNFIRNFEKIFRNTKSEEEKKELYQKYNQQLERSKQKNEQWIRLTKEIQEKIIFSSQIQGALSVLSHKRQASVQ